MKRLAQILGVIGGLGAVLWAMRDRLASVAIPREPQPPAFRAPPRDASSGGPGGEDGEAVGDGEPKGPQMVTDVRGIGPVYATRLEAAGVTNLSDLASSDPDEIAKAAQVPLSRAEEWVKAAGTLLEE